MLSPRISVPSPHHGRPDVPLGCWKDTKFVNTHKIWRRWSPESVESLSVEGVKGSILSVQTMNYVQKTLTCWFQEADRCVEPRNDDCIFFRSREAPCVKFDESKESCVWWWCWPEYLPSNLYPIVCTTVYVHVFCECNLTFLLLVLFLLQL